MFAFETILTDTSESEPQQIARGLRQRDIALLHALVAQYQYRLIRYLIHLTGRRDAVDDLVQETWLRVLERGGSYNGHAPFAPWLFTIARNLATDHLRKRRIFSLDSTNDPDGASEPESNSIASTEPSPFERAARSEDAQHMALALKDLPPLYREVLVLRFQEELSLEEIAAIAGASVSTIASRIYRGLATLRAQMTGEHYAD
jgi:RNA polymerase sigma-70 factor (ECF subfamily)